MSKYVAVITCRTVKGEQKTAADVYGSWAVHQSLDPNSREWTITQVATGLAIPREHTRLLRKAQAIEVAKTLDREVGGRRSGSAIGNAVLQIIHTVLTDGAAVLV